MKDRICLITGASSGIGKATALELAKMNAQVVIVARNKDRGKAVVSEIIAASGNSNVDLIVADLSSQKDIRQLVQEFKSKYNQLHVLVNNAGTYSTVRSITEDGLETTFAVNYLAPFLLTNLLLDVLKANAPSRVVNVAGAYHRKATMNFDDLMSEQDYSGTKANNMAKLGLVLFTYELARKLKGTGVTSNCLHPGAIATGLIEKDPNYPRSSLMIYRLFSRFFSKPEKGAETPVYLASSDEVADITGKYFEKMKETKSSPDSYDESAALRLWNISLNLAGLGS
ncbi:MAG: SDR family oxidoreductase [Candidatus Thorarchaeota archaeon]